MQHNANHKKDVNTAIEFYSQKENKTIWHDNHRLVCRCTHADSSSK